MAAIEVRPLTDRLDDDEVADLTKALKKAHAPALPKGDDEAGATVADGIDGDLLAEFRDRLDAEDVACDIYLPVEWDGQVKVHGLTVGSVSALTEVLEELKDEMDAQDEADEEEDDEDYEDEDEEAEDDAVEEDDDDDDDYHSVAAMDRKLREVWKAYWKAAEQALKRNLPLYIRED
jgi:hypothetical protein